MVTNRINRSDWPLIALSFAKDGKLTPVQIQKVLFLLRQELPKHFSSGFYEFVPYNYGPFDSQVYRDLDLQALGGNVSTEPDGSGRWSSYVITLQGHQSAMKLRGELDPTVAKYLEAVVTWLKPLSFSQLVRAIYTKYPQYAANSVFNN